jgi:hypothetical protein
MEKECSVNVIVAHINKKLLTSVSKLRKGMSCKTSGVVFLVSSEPFHFIITVGYVVFEELR